MSPTIRRERLVCKYQLYGVVYHHGLAATGGHYTLDVLHPNPAIYAKDTSSLSTTRPESVTSASTNTQEGWLRFNDESVRRLTREEVFRRPTQATGNFMLQDQDDQTAYLLFYRRITK
jgi:ubiquitin carboxyl-terminal hydrolase 10